MGRDERKQPYYCFVFFPKNKVKEVEKKKTNHKQEMLVPSVLFSKKVHEEITSCSLKE